jgi:hypothetical protein
MCFAVAVITAGVRSTPAVLIAALIGLFSRLRPLKDEHLVGYRGRLPYRCRTIGGGGFPT